MNCSNHNVKTAASGGLERRRIHQRSEEKKAKIEEDETIREHCKKLYFTFSEQLAREEASSPAQLS
jgi:hypothetical protein